MEGSLILFAFLVLIYIIISDIITMLFRLTGLSEERARFQVISLLTNSGFTTRESEAVVSTKLRRRLARATMLFGYTFTLTIVSAMVNFFLTLGKSELGSLLYLLPVLIGLMVGVHFIRRSGFFKTKFDGWIEKIAYRIMFGREANSVVIMEDYGDLVAAHVNIKRVPEILREKTLAQSELMSRYNINIVLIKNENGEARQANADTMLMKNDILMVVGRRRDIRNVFERG